mgnify:CR=1 FL=1
MTPGAFITLNSTLKNVLERSQTSSISSIRENTSHLMKALNSSSPSPNFFRAKILHSEELSMSVSRK